ncbi:hypothetical protein NE237_008243 [Protea cynaroides]|uniref:HAT C-terminal dimerisation domain-containing protein n=1 Tax=Protea cynaroides TaxID=273540 RepID=A0A9Q0GLM1_9MAGN|nr:hypothetical protein NE237_008243 [Protea cynaroides]
MALEIPTRVDLVAYKRGIDVWWEFYCGHVPELQRFARRVLSQTCSSSSAERNVSVFSVIKSKRSGWIHVE